MYLYDVIKNERNVRNHFIRSIHALIQRSVWSNRVIHKTEEVMEELEVLEVIEPGMERYDYPETIQVVRKEDHDKQVQALKDEIERVKSIARSACQIGRLIL